MARGNRNITSANATAILTVDNAFPAGIIFEYFSSDQSFSGDEVEIAETKMGVDGKLHAGWIPAERNVTFTFSPDSPTIIFLEELIAVQNVAKNVFFCDLPITVPSVGKLYHYTNGVLKKTKMLPDGKKTLDPVSYTFTFEDMKVTPISTAALGA